MSEADLVAKKREETGSGPMGRLRKEGFIPAVIYSHGSAAEKLTLERRIVDRILESGTHVVSLKDESGNVRRAVIREVQIQPVSQETLHVDFQEVSAHEQIEITVPLVFRGEPKGVKEDGGVLDMQAHEVTIACPADADVDEIRVDVSGLGLNDSIHMHEVKLPEGVSAVTPADEVLATVRPPREEVEEEVAAADTEVQAQPEVIGEKEREERENEEGK